MQTLALRLVFSNPVYLILSVTIFSGMLVMLSIVSEFIFIEPYLLFHLAEEDVASFSLIVLVSALSGLVISMSICRLRMERTRQVSSGFIGSIIGASAGACSCSSVGFAIISAFGVAGGAATAFLTNYAIPLRLISIGILVYAYYTTAKALAAQCKIQKK